MPVYDFSVAADKAGNLESELLDRGAHPFHRGIVPARVSGVGDQLLDRPDLNVCCCCGMRRTVCGAHGNLLRAFRALRLVVALSDFIRQQMIENTDGDFADAKKLQARCIRVVRSQSEHKEGFAPPDVLTLRESTGFRYGAGPSFRTVSLGAGVTSSF
jgi:hypothetical protein